MHRFICTVSELQFRGPIGVPVDRDQDERRATRWYGFQVSCNVYLSVVISRALQNLAIVHKTAVDNGVYRCYAVGSEVQINVKLKGRAGRVLTL